MTPESTKVVAFAFSTDKPTITLNITVSLGGKMLPLEKIYGWKTTQSSIKIKYLKGFSLIVNEKHYSIYLSFIIILRKS